MAPLLENISIFCAATDTAQTVSEGISPALRVVCTFCLFAMFVAGLLTLFRLLIGPRAADRAVAMDLLTSVFIGIICILCMMWNEMWYFDAVWILTLVGFLGTAAIARYIEKGKVF